MLDLSRRRRSSISALKAARTIEEILFVLMTIGDDRAVRATYVAGERVYDRDRAEPFLHATSKKSGENH